MPAELIFEIDVVSPEILMEEIDRYNHMHGTDFIIEKYMKKQKYFFAKSEQQPLQKIFLVLVLLAMKKIYGNKGK